MPTPSGVAPHGPGTYRILYVLAPGRSGSTLLNLLLNGHTRVLGLSEVGRLGRGTSGERRGLAADVASPFWSAVLDEYERRTGRPRTGLHLEGRRGRTDDDIALFDVIAEHAGVSVLVDASKSVRRLLRLRRAFGRRLWVIRLTRDGRGVYWSHRRSGDSHWASLDPWLRKVVTTSAVRPLFGRRWRTVRYETLATDPEAELRRLVGWLGLDYEPGMLRFDAPDRGVGGNRKSRRTSSVAGPDDRWMWEMPALDRVVSGLVTFLPNRLLGYPIRARRSDRR